MKDKVDSKKIKLKVLKFPIMLLVINTVALIAVVIDGVQTRNPDILNVQTIIIVGLIYLLICAIILFIALRKYDKHLSMLVDTDKLTSGINYEKFLADAQAKIDAEPDSKFAVFYGDIQNFKYVNDTFGYDVGDNLLMFISQRIKEAIGDKGFFARISADNYTAIVKYDNKNEFVEPIYSIIDDICWYDEIQRAHYKPEIYVGVFCSGESDAKLTISEMIDRANMAQKSVKGSSEYHIAYYNEEIRERIIAEKELERRMETALAHEEFKVYYQPKYEVDSGEIVGAEALVRWDSPESGFMSPAKFIPLFEQNGFIINLDQYVFETVCKNMRQWIDDGIKVVPVSINVSRLQFYRLDFVKRYTKIKEKYDIPDGLLELEFTESIVFENLDILRKIVLSLKKVGFSCSIDDFGSGYSSLNILKSLPMDTLKLDKLFFDESDNIERDKALISSVITMSRALNMKTVAEGIENWAQVIFLKEIGCDIIQGFVYSEPITCSRYTQLLEGNRRKEIPVNLKPGRSVVTDEEDSGTNSKLSSVVSLLPGMLIEVDFNKDTYKFINADIISNFTEETIPRSGTGYNSILNSIIDKYVHPDDIKTVKSRCTSIAVMSAFYQNETKIITEMRIFSKITKDYEWAKVTVVRANGTGEADDFNAYVYFEPSIGSNVDNTKDQIIVSEPVLAALMNICSFIYEIDVTDGTFKKLYCNTEEVGNQPESGDLAWLRECYLKKNIEKDDLERAYMFTDPEIFCKLFNEEGKTQITTTTKTTLLGKQKLMRMTLVAKKNSEVENKFTKFYLICNAKDEKYQFDQVKVELDKVLNNALDNFCNLIVSIDIEANKYEMFNGNTVMLNMPTFSNYSEAAAEFLGKIVHPDDSERVEKMVLLNNIKKAIDKGDKASCVSYRCRTSNKKDFVNSTMVRLAYMVDDKPYCTFFINGVETML